MRSMALEYESDLVTHTMDLQYFFGREILVAPIYSQYNRRTVYLPAGKWVEYWTGDVVTGPQVLAVAASLDQIPLFIRGGSIIPMGPEMEYTGEKKPDELTLDVYPQENCEFTLYDNGNAHTLSCSTTAKSIFLSLPPCGKSYFVQINEASSPCEIRLGNSTAPEIKDLNEFKRSNTGWRYFGEGKKYTGIKIPESDIRDGLIMTFEKK